LIGNGFDAYSPRQIAERLEAACLAKAATPLLSLVMLGLLAGAFIGLGALFSVIVLSDASLGFAAARVLGGVVFSLGLVLVVVAGAELFTGNNLLAMAWAQGSVSTRDVLHNWAVVCAANFAGAAGLAALVFLSGQADMNGGAVGLHSSANPLFASAAQVFGDAVIAVVLTGGDRDATDGVQTVHHWGGIVIAQDEASSQVFAMPRSAIATGAVHAILPLGRIASELERLARTPARSGPSPLPDPPQRLRHFG
jgi:hypothetical protein